MTREGKRIRTAHLDVRTAASPLGACRVGFIVPKHKQTAVARNRLKRRLRELVRLHLLPGAPAADVVIRARREAYDASFEALARDVERAAVALKRLGTRDSGTGTRESRRETSATDTGPETLA